LAQIKRNFQPATREHRRKESYARTDDWGLTNREFRFAVPPRFSNVRQILNIACGCILIDILLLFDNSIFF